MSPAAVATARLRALGARLRAAVTLRRTDRSRETYVLRVACLFLLLVVLPTAKLLQLGVVGFALALLKVAAGVAVVTGVLWLVFAAQAWAHGRSRA